MGERHSYYLVLRFYAFSHSKNTCFAVHHDGPPGCWQPFATTVCIAWPFIHPQRWRVLGFPANFPLLIDYWHWKWHGTQPAIDFPIANLFKVATQETFQHDLQHFLMTRLTKLPIQPTRQQHSHMQFNFEKCNNLYKTKFHWINSGHI